MTTTNIEPCVRCGECMSACKEGLAPVLLWQTLQANMHTTAIEQGLDRCTGCGHCQAVCPSHIPLAITLIDALNALDQTRWLVRNSDGWRQRHDWRQHRLERERTDRVERLAAKAIGKLDDPHFSETAKQARIEAALHQAVAQHAAIAGTDDTGCSSHALDDAKRARIRDIMSRAQAKQSLAESDVTPATDSKQARIAAAMAKATALRRAQNKAEED